MVIRIVLTILFLIIGFFSYKRSIIVEKEKNPKLIKDNKLNLLTSTIPYTLSKVFFVYAFFMISGIMLLQSLCTEKNIINKYEITSINEEYIENSNKNQTYIFNNDNDTIKLKNIDYLNIVYNADAMYIEEYNLTSSYEIVNILMYGAYEKGIIIHMPINKEES